MMSVPTASIRLEILGFSSLIKRKILVSNAHFSRLEGANWKTYPTTAITNELRVTNLQPFKSYTFKVFSANEIGSSAASIEARISTEQGRPSAPLNLQVKSMLRSLTFLTL